MSLPHPTRFPNTALTSMNRFIFRASLLILIISFLVLPSTHLRAEDTVTPVPSFQAGAAIADVTPPLGTSMNGGFHDRKAAFVHDPQHARALVLDDGKNRVALVVVDACMIGRKLFDDAKSQITAATEVPASHIMMSTTHSHSCGTMEPTGQSDPDPEYQRFVAQRISDVVRCAIQNLTLAQIAWGEAQVPQHVFNRRYEMKEGGIPSPNPLGGTDDKVRMNPGTGNPLVIKPAGPTDPAVPFIAVRSTDGHPIAVYANYALHYVGGTRSTDISADYYGAFPIALAKRIAPEATDPPFVGIMSNGASGDVNNIDVLGKPAKLGIYEKIGIVANDVAEEVASVYKTLTWQNSATLGAAQEDLALGVRLPTDQELADAIKAAKESKSYPIMETIAQVYARETIFMAEYPKQVSAPIQVLRIGDLRVAGIPAEPFVEIGLDLKKRHPQCIVVGLANAYHGYLPTPEQHALGGYETWRARSSYLEVDASTKIVEKVDALLKAMDQSAEK